jgi:hypothetical protein
MSNKLAQDARRQFFDANGNPLVGGQLFYANRTTTKLGTTSDYAGSIANTNPIILDAQGRTPTAVYLQNSLFYTEVLAPATDSDPPGSPIYTEHDLIGAGSDIVTLTEWIDPFTGVGTYISATSFSVAGDQTGIFTAGRRIQVFVAAGTVYGTIKSAIFAGGITTIVLQMDSGVIDAGLGSFYLGLINPTNTSLPYIDQYGSINAIINGGFDLWDHGTSQTGNGYLTANMWTLFATGTTHVTSRQTVVLGDINATYFRRSVVTSVAGAANCFNTEQKIEGVDRFNGKTITLSFLAKVNANKNIAIEFVQDFGTGGSPSAQVTGIGTSLIPITTTWAEYFITVNVPSIVGKTLGSGANDSLLVQFWFDAGSSFTSRTGGLGQQSGTFDIANVQITEGPRRYKFFRESPQATRNKAERYAEYIGTGLSGVFTGTTTCKFWGKYRVKKRAIPIITLTTTTPTIVDNTLGLNKVGTGSTITLNDDRTSGNAILAINNIAASTAGDLCSPADDIFYLNSYIP